MKLRNKKTGETYSMWHICIGGEEITSVKQFNDTFEDYTPQEPLINDKDVRNIIRYIASTYGSDQVYVTNFGTGDIKIKFSFENAGSTYLCFSLNTGIHVPDGLYTITELCGEK